jgi:hypothetical protein
VGEPAERGAERVCRGKAGHPELFPGCECTLPRPSANDADSRSSSDRYETGWKYQIGNPDRQRLSDGTRVGALKTTTKFQQKLTEISVRILSILDFSVLAKVLVSISQSISQIRIVFLHSILM